MGSSIAARGDNELITLLARLASKLNRMCWIDRPGPICAAKLLDNRSKVSRCYPGASQVCVWIDDQFYAMQWHITLEEGYMMLNTCNTQKPCKLRSLHLIWCPASD